MKGSTTRRSWKHELVLFFQELGASDGSTAITPTLGTLPVQCRIDIGESVLNGDRRALGNGADLPLDYYYYC